MAGEEVEMLSKKFAGVNQLMEGLNNLLQVSDPGCIATSGESWASPQVFEAAEFTDGSECQDARFSDEALKKLNSLAEGEEDSSTIGECTAILTGLVDAGKGMSFDGFEAVGRLTGSVIANLQTLKEKKTADVCPPLFENPNGVPDIFDENSKPTFEEANKWDENEIVDTFSEYCDATRKAQQEWDAKTGEVEGKLNAQLEVMGGFKKYGGQEASSCEALSKVLESLGKKVAEAKKESQEASDAADAKLKEFESEDMQDAEDVNACIKNQVECKNVMTEAVCTLRDALDAAKKATVDYIEAQNTVAMKVANRVAKEKSWRAGMDAVLTDKQRKAWAYDQVAGHHGYCERVKKDVGELAKIVAKAKSDLEEGWKTAAKDQGMLKAERDALTKRIAEGIDRKLEVQLKLRKDNREEMTKFLNLLDQMKQNAQAEGHRRQLAAADEKVNSTETAKAKLPKVLQEHNLPDLLSIGDSDRGSPENIS